MKQHRDSSLLEKWGGKDIVKKLGREVNYSKEYLNQLLLELKNTQLSKKTKRALAILLMM